MVARRTGKTKMEFRSVVAIVDALGIVRIEGTTNGNALTLDVHSLATGLYYVRARNTAGSSTAWKFLVSR